MCMNEITGAALGILLLILAGLITWWLFDKLMKRLSQDLEKQVVQFQRLKMQNDI